MKCCLCCFKSLYFWSFIIAATEAHTVLKKLSIAIVCSIRAGRPNIYCLEGLGQVIENLCIFTVSLIRGSGEGKSELLRIWGKSQNQSQLSIPKINVNRELLLRFIIHFRAFSPFSKVSYFFIKEKPWQKRSINFGSRVYSIVFDPYNQSQNRGDYVYHMRKLNGGSYIFLSQ